MGIHKKVFSIVLLVVIFVNFTGCFTVMMQFEVDNENEYTINDYINGEDEYLEKIRLNNVTILPSISEYKDYYEIWIGIISKEKNKEIFIKGCTLKNDKGEILFDDQSLSKIIFTNQKLTSEYESGYVGGADIGKFSKGSIKSGMKLFLTLSVESECGENKVINEVFTANAYLWS